MCSSDLKFFPQNKIFCIGDNLLYKNIKNLGVVSDNRVKYLLSKTKNTYITAENSLSFYCLDSILNSVIIFPKNIKFNTNIILKKKKSFSVYNINKKRLNYLHSHTISNLKKLF